MRYLVTVPDPHGLIAQWLEQPHGDGSRLCVEVESDDQHVEVFRESCARAAGVRIADVVVSAIP